MLEFNQFTLMRQEQIAGIYSEESVRIGKILRRYKGKVEVSLKVVKPELRKQGSGH